MLVSKDSSAMTVSIKLLAKYKTLKFLHYFFSLGIVLILLLFKLRIIRFLNSYIF